MKEHTANCYVQDHDQGVASLSYARLYVSRKDAHIQAGEQANKRTGQLGNLTERAKLDQSGEIFLHNNSHVFYVLSLASGRIDICILGLAKV